MKSRPLFILGLRIYYVSINIIFKAELETHDEHSLVCQKVNVYYQLYSFNQFLIDTNFCSS